MIKLRTRVGPKGQVVIPKPVREAMGIKVGDDVYFSVEGTKIIVDPRNPRDLVREFLDALPRRRLPRRIDWDREHYSQFE